MPLIKANLEKELRKLLDQNYSEFVGFPPEILGVASNWSFAINEYAKHVIPISTTSVLAVEAFKVPMLLITNTPPTGLAMLSLACTQYAVQIALGMVGAGFVGTPPPVPVDFSSIVPIGLGGASGEVVAGLMATIIDTWFRTGTAVPIAGGAIIPWS